MQQDPLINDEINHKLFSFEVTWTSILKFSFNRKAKSANEQQNTPSMKAC